jgi:hypothetical protein
VSADQARRYHSSADRQFPARQCGSGHCADHRFSVEEAVGIILAAGDASMPVVDVVHG